VDCDEVAEMAIPGILPDKPLVVPVVLEVTLVTEVWFAIAEVNA
jgi:hypothetical protein